MLQLTMSSAMLNGFTPPMRLLVRRIGLLFRRLVFDFANNSQQNETPSHGTKILVLHFLCSVYMRYHPLLFCLKHRMTMQGSAIRFLKKALNLWY